MTNVSGSAPYFSELARSVADSWVKLPEISAWPLVIGLLTTGADSTCPSSTMANGRFCPFSAWVTVEKVSVPSPSSSSDTTHCGFWLGGTAFASVRLVPSMTAGLSRYLAPWSSQVMSGLSGLSLTSAAASASSGQVNSVKSFVSPA